MALTLTSTLSLAFGGAWPWVSSLAIFDGDGGFPGLGGEFSSGIEIPTIVETARPVADLALLGWNGVFVLAGRSAGVVPYLLPTLLLLGLWEPRTRRSPLVIVAVAAALLAIVVWPFDWAGQEPGLGNALLLPVFGALLLVPTRRCSLWAALATVAVAGLFLWPTWLDSLGLWRGGSAPGSTIAPLASRLLPHESSRRPLGRDFVRQVDASVLPAGGGVEERRGRLYLTGERWGNVVVASPVPLDRLYLAFDGQAGTELEVAGGSLGDTLFRGDGGIGFEVVLDGASRRHRMWWSSEAQSLYDLRLRLPKAPPSPDRLRCRGRVMSNATHTWIEELRGRLSTPPPTRLAPSEARQAAILVPLYVEAGQLWTVLTKRSEELPHHSSQIAFPGGARETGEDSWGTALRETEEELGLPGNRVVRLGQLDEAWTPSGFHIVPCVGAVPFPLELDPNESEIAETFSVPLLEFANPRMVEERPVVINGRERLLRIYHVGGRQVWGVTARVLQNLMVRLGFETVEEEPAN